MKNRQRNTRQGRAGYRKARQVRAKLEGVARLGTARRKWAEQSKVKALIF